MEYYAQAKEYLEKNMQVQIFGNTLQFPGNAPEFFHG